jgi:hypothetical protein
MPEITVTLVDHTDGTSENLKALIQNQLSNLFADLLFSDSEPSVVNMRWMRPTPAPNDQDLVLHFVENVSSSYISQKMPGKGHRVDGGGFTRTQAGVTGSEFYKLPIMNGNPTHLTAIGYAKLAAHEAIHNMTGMDNAQLHGRGGLAGSPPQLPVTDDNRAIVQAALANLPDQLL